MIPKDSGQTLARLLSDLSDCEGAALDLALAGAAELFAGLGAQAAARRCGAAAAQVTLERAQRELSYLISAELLRLCELAASARAEQGRSAHAAQDLAELLHEELDCAAAMRELEPGLLARLRRLAQRLPTGVDDSDSFRVCAASLRRGLPSLFPA